MSLTCRGCGAPITFGITAKGYRMPIDPDPVKDGTGNLRLQYALDPRELPEVIQVKPGEGTHVSHFVTCPKGPNFRSR